MMPYKQSKVFLLSKINVNYKNGYNYIMIGYIYLVINKINDVYNILILDFYSERFIINRCRKWLTIV